MSTAGCTESWALTLSQDSNRVGQPIVLDGALLHESRRSPRCGAERTGARVPSGGERGVDTDHSARNPLDAIARGSRPDPSGARDINTSTRSGSQPPTKPRSAAARACARSRLAGSSLLPPEYLPPADECGGESLRLSANPKAHASAVPAMIASVSRMYVSASISLALLW
jgi:hypothetical protein